MKRQIGARPKLDIPPKNSHLISAMLFAFAAILLTADLVTMIFVPSHMGLLLLFPSCTLFMSMSNGCLGIANLERNIDRAAQKFNDQAGLGYVSLCLQLIAVILIAFH